MRAPLPIRLTRKAAGHIEEAVTWWADHRAAAPDALIDELERAYSLLARHPQVGARARSVRLPGVRRIHLHLTNYDLYYRVTAQGIEILALWHGSRVPPAIY